MHATEQFERLKSLLNTTTECLASDPNNFALKLMIDQTTGQLRRLVTDLNTNYRAGQPLVSDEQYDTMLEYLQSITNAEEYADFAKSLTEPKGEVAHSYIMGSLKKLRFGENKVAAWVKQHCSRYLLASAKLDGLSFAATYINGIFVSGRTRGDGHKGTDISSKLALILPSRLNKPVTLDVRGELTLTGDDHIAMGFKNRRNGSVGLVNRDNADPKDVAKLRAFAYQIKSGFMADAAAIDQLKTLRGLGFDVTSWKLFDLSPHLHAPATIERELAEYLDYQKRIAPCDLDGLVLCDDQYRLEDAFHPDGMVAFKVNQDAVTTTVIGIEWNVSKNGLLKPVILVAPTEIDGTTVSRVTGNNALWLKDNGIGEGASIGIIKSGEIIPKCVSVYQTAPVAILDVCPSCGTKLDMNGVDLCCDNENCGAAGVKEVESFLSKLNVEGAGAKTLENLGIRCMDDLLAWTPDTNYKGQRNLWFELEKKVFNAPAGKLFAAMRFDGFGRKLVNRLVEFYGSRHAATGAIHAAKHGEAPVGGYPEGFTQLNMSKAADSWFANLEMTGRICSDSRYQEPAEEIRITGGKLAGKSILFTGTMSMNRKLAEKMVTDNGGTIASSVSKNLSFLVAGDAAGSKLDKANKLGVQVLSEQEFKGMADAA